MRLWVILICLLLFGSTIFSQKRVVPILDASSNSVLGGVRNGRFVKPQEAIKILRLGDQFTYFGIYSQNLGGRKLIKINQPNEYCSETVTVEIEPTEPDGILIGGNANWDPMIRTHKILFDGFQPNWAELKFWNNAVYNKAAADFLKTKDISKPTARITQAFRADIDGDKMEEVILVGNKFDPSVSESPKLGDYSFVLMRKVVGKTVKNILVSGAINPKDFPDGSLSLLHVTAINDLNSDGKLEIVVHGYEYEGYSTAVYQFTGNSFSRVLGNYCGL